MHVVEGITSSQLSLVSYKGIGVSVKAGLWTGLWTGLGLDFD